MGHDTMDTLLLKYRCASLSSLALGENLTKRRLVLFGQYIMDSSVGAIATMRKRDPEGVQSILGISLRAGKVRLLHVRCRLGVLGNLGELVPSPLQIHCTL